jgi:hypothetical protein
MSSIYALPVPDGEAHILQYFTAASAFGADFDDMRRAMAQVVAAFEQERGSRTRQLPGALGLTVQFLSQVTPKQSILTGSSAFRLDRLATYLSAAGPQTYFQQGRQVAYTPLQARWFADEVLEEVLGVYIPPAVAYDTHVQYVAAAFAIPANRARADQHYLAILKQIGIFWGTLWALRGCSHGESFVARNVGLKSVWEHGQWQVKVIFMDHDNLHLTGQQDFHPLAVLPGMSKDAIHICGGPMGRQHIKGEIGHLEEIYQVAQHVCTEGRKLLYSSLAEAYRTTMHTILHHPGLGEFFSAAYVDQMHAWDMVVGVYLRAGGSATWTVAARTFLRERGYGEARTEEYVGTVERYADFLTQYAFVYGPAAQP